MSAAEELSTVVDTARKTEMDGRKFYVQTAAGTENPLARRMFESLAAAEEHHLALIDKLAAGEFEAPAYDHDFYRNLTTLFSEVGGDVKPLAASTPDDIAALDIAIEMEDKSMAFYRKWAETGAEDQVRKFCARMYAEEEDHWRILQSTKDYLDSTGNWFMVQEGWSFDGG
jgi:rubrerythrin